MRKIFLLAGLLGLCVSSSEAGGRKRKKPTAADSSQAATTPLLPQKQDYRQLGAPLPEMRVVTAEGTTITAADLRAGRNCFVVLFNPTCDHCEITAASIAKAAEEFRKNSVVFMATPAMTRYLPNFKKTTGLDAQPQMPVGVDSAGFVEKAYLYSALPQVNVYDKDQRLIRTFAGETPVDSLRRYIR